WSPLSQGPCRRQTRAVIVVSVPRAPSWPPDSMSPDFRGGSGEMCELLHTSPVVQKMMGNPKSKYETDVTATEAGARHAARAVDTESTDGLPVAAESGQALASTSTIIRACPRTS